MQEQTQGERQMSAGIGENLFSSMSVNVICHRDRFLRDAVSGLQWSL